jgi:hypothetical protein
MNEFDKLRADGKANNIWSNAACYLFQPENMLCGAVSDVPPASPTNASYGLKQGSFWSHPVFGPSDRNIDAKNLQEDSFDAAMRALDAEYKFQPHWCEDREFFVIHTGAMSVDAESITGPSIDESTSESSKSSLFNLEALRDGVPTFESRDHICDAPFPVLVYREDRDEETVKKREYREAKPTTKPGVVHTTVTPEDLSMYDIAIAKKLAYTRTPDWVIKDYSNKGCIDGPQERRYPDEDRVKELLAPFSYTPNSDKTVPSGYQVIPPCIPSKLSCTANQEQPQSLELMRVSDPNACVKSLEHFDPSKKFWMEKFTEAANKVIQSDSSRRILELIDPTIPRESDIRHREQHHLRGRQRYRKVLKKYLKHRLLVLILDPSTRVFEMLELPFRPDETTIADVLIMARIQTTDDRLRYKEYVGLCRPNLDPPPPPPVGKAQPSTPSGCQLSPPPLNRVTKNSQSSPYDEERREDDNKSLFTESTSLRVSCMIQETDTEELVWSILSPSDSTVPCTIPSQLALALPYSTMPLLGDIVVTIPLGYTGEEVARYAQTILQTPLFLRWIRSRYLNDLQRDNDELLSRAKAMGGSNVDHCTTIS